MAGAIARVVMGVMLRIWALGPAFSYRQLPLLLLSALPLVAAAQRPAPPPFKAPSFREAAPVQVSGATTVSGHVEHPTTKVISLSYGPDWRGHLTQTVEAKLSPAGDFQIVLPRLAAPAEVRLGYDNTYATLYLTPGDDLRLTFEPDRFERTLAFAGRGANANNYLTQVSLAASQDDEQGRTPDTRAGRLSAADMRRTTDTYRRQRLANLTAYAAARPLPAAFVRQQRQAIDDEWASSLLSYASRQSAERKQGGYATLPVGYYDFLREMQLSRQDSALSQSAFQSLLMTFGFTQLNDEDGTLPTGRDAGRRFYQRATDALGDGRVRDVAVGQYLLGKVESEHTDIRSLLPDFRTNNQDSTIARAVRQAVRAHLALANGQPAPDFTVTDASGKKVALSSLRGKVVYLDFWATWCAPCLAEMPASLELRKKFAGRDVVFLYVSLDSQTADWQKYLAAKQVASPNAVQLHDGAAFDGPAARAFNVQSIPSYWLIGRDGRIIANNPPRPSTSPAIDNALEQALKP
jgi:thiol-disulfide isomerase/thioredoxin